MMNPETAGLVKYNGVYLPPGVHDWFLDGGELQVWWMGRPSDLGDAGTRFRLANGPQSSMILRESLMNLRFTLRAPALVVPE